MFLEWNDPALDFVPANPPVRPFRYDARLPEKSTFPQSERELKDAVNWKPRYEFDDKEETLVGHLYRNEFKIGKLNEALGYFRKERGKTVRRIVLYVHQQVFVDHHLEFEFHKFTRDEGLERRSGNGYFALVRNLKLRNATGAKEGETQSVLNGK